MKASQLINLTTRVLLFTLLIVCTDQSFAKSNSSKTKVEKLDIPSDESLGFFVSSRTETLEHAKRLGLMPIALPEAFSKRDDVKAVIENLVAKKLTDAGYAFFPPSGYQDSYDTLNKKLGGVYNADTGYFNSDQDKAIKAAAKRDFMEKNKLDALLMVSVRVETARFFGSTAYFDHVEESSVGKVPQSALAEIFLGNPGLRGSLPALSIVIQIMNPQDKIVYGGIGGIQLINYYSGNSKTGVSGFLVVPHDQLLRDEKRIERGIDIAILPLIQTPEEIARNAKNPKLNPKLIKADDLPPLPAGNTQKDELGFKVDREKILSEINRIVILPVSTTKIDVSQDVKDRYLNLIEQQLNSHVFTKEKIEIIKQPDPFLAMMIEVQKMKGLFNPYTGAYDEERVAAARKKALSTLNLTPNTLVLYPSIVRSRSIYKQGVAYWHGATQDIYTFESPQKRGFWGPPPDSSEGHLAASSLFIQLRDAEDKLVYQGAGGIELLETPPSSQEEKPVIRAATELFKKTEREEPATYLALRSLFKSEAEIDLELHPEKAKQLKEKNKKAKKSNAENTEK